MSEEVAALQIRLEAITNKFERSWDRAERKVRSSASSMEKRVRRLDTRLSNVGSTAGRGLTRQGRANFINFGQQLQDVAVQAEQGTNAIRIFSQQGPQIFSVFGPVGVTLGILAATLGATASAFIDTSDASDDANDSISDMQSSLGQAESRFSGLIDAAVAYQDAIRAAGDESTETANKVVAATEREFQARKRLLNLDLVQARDDLQATRDRQAALVESLTELEQGVSTSDPAATRRGALGPGLDDPSLRRERLLEARPDSLTSSGLSVREQTQEAENLRREITRIGAESTITEGRLERMQEALSASFEDLASAEKSGGGGGGGRSRGGSGSTTRASRDAFGSSITRVMERIEALQLERQQIGLSDKASTELVAAFEREKLVRELINAAQKDGNEATEEEINLANALASETEALTLAIFDEAEAIESANEAAKKAKKDQEDLARSISTTADNFISAVQSAESFEDALKKIGLELLNLAANAVLGKGPLGGAFNDLIGVSADGLVGLIGSGSTAASTAALSSGAAASALPAGFAKGGAFSGGRVTPFATGGIVTGPTTFPMASGIGLMGEAGPEAIMPLSRGPGGKLGVVASGGGSPVVVNITNTSGSEITARQNGPNLEVMVEHAVAKSIGQGGRVHKAIRQSFQLSQPTTRR